MQGEWDPRSVSTRAGAVTSRSGDAVRNGRSVKVAGGCRFRGVTKPRVVSRERGKLLASHASRARFKGCSSSLVRVLDIDVAMPALDPRKVRKHI